MLYLRKRERLKYMVFYINGLLCDVDDHPISVPEGFAKMYAMDRYCNLFVQTEELQTYMISNRKRGRSNHSSLVSGQDVLCAGTIAIKEGTLKMISNNSGHYKPTRRQLHEAVKVLEAEGVDLSQATVDCREPKRFDPDRGKLMSIDYRATDFAREIEPFFNLGVTFVEWSLSPTSPEAREGSAEASPPLS